MALAGKYRVSASTPMGERVMFMELTDSGGNWTGTLDGDSGVQDMRNLKEEGDTFSAAATVNSPMGVLDVTFSCTVNGDSVKGELITSFMPIPLVGERV